MAELLPRTGFRFGTDWDDPRTLGLLGVAAGLLEASGPSPRKITLAEALGRGLRIGMGGFQMGQQMLMEKQKLDQQMLMEKQRNDLLKAQADQATMQLKKQQQLQDFIMGRLGLSAPDLNQSQTAQQTLTEGGAQGGAGPTTDSAQYMGGLVQQQQAQQPPQQRAGQFPFSMNDLVALKTLGGPDLLDMFKYANDGAKKEAGAYYTNPMTGQTVYMPKLPEGSTMTPDGRVIGLPGAAQTNAAYKGAEAGAIEGAKAQYDFIDVYDPNSRQMVKVPKATLAKGGGRVNFGSPGGFAVSQQRPDDLLYDNENAKASASQYQALQSAGMKAPGQIAKYKQLESLLANHDGGKLSPLGMDLAQLGNSLGLKVDKNLPNKEAAAALINELALALRDPSNGGGMPGALSDADRQFLISSVPNLSQSAQGRRQMVQMAIAVQQRNIDAARMARKWQQRYGRLDAVNPVTGKSFQDNLQEWAARNPLFAQ